MRKYKLSAVSSRPSVPIMNIYESTGYKRSDQLLTLAPKWNVALFVFPFRCYANNALQYSTGKISYGLIYDPCWS